MFINEFMALTNEDLLQKMEEQYDALNRKMDGLKEEYRGLNRRVDSLARLSYNSNSNQMRVMQKFPRPVGCIWGDEEWEIVPSRTNPWDEPW